MGALPLAFIVHWMILKEEAAPEGAAVVVRSPSRHPPSSSQRSCSQYKRPQSLGRAQALLGFQMAVMLTGSFDRLPSSSKLVHAAALCCMGLAIIVLIAPAAIHRLSFRGEDSEEFHDLGSRLIVLAAVPLATGIALDLYVAATKATESSLMGAVIAGLAAVVMIGLWFAYPIARRMSRSEVAR